MTRWLSNPQRTLELTRKSQEAMELLLAEGVEVGLIATLSKVNATKDKLPVMKQWFSYLDALGLKSARLHLMETENKETETALKLSDEENVYALWDFYELESELVNLKFDVSKDMVALLMGNDGSATCVWRGCDHMNTVAVYGIERDGSLSNCGRVYKDGVEYNKTSTIGYERYVSLYSTPQEQGGCKGCRFFLMCKGWCPGTAVDGDWRNKTSYCEVWKSLYGKLEQEIIDRGITPISLDSNLEKLEQIIVYGWINGHNILMETVLPLLKDPSSDEMEIAQKLIGRASYQNAVRHDDSVHGDHVDYSHVTTSK